MAKCVSEVKLRRAVGEAMFHEPSHEDDTKLTRGRRVAAATHVRLCWLLICLSLTGLRRVLAELIARLDSSECMARPCLLPRCLANEAALVPTALLPDVASLSGGRDWMASY
ncbi:hypothetical protein MN608_05905 [Microdochium nivale]|nr:hypothetical protein MN608_05905 [Microdochium nivale]